LSFNKASLSKSVGNNSSKMGNTLKNKGFLCQNRKKYLNVKKELRFRVHDFATTLLKCFTFWDNPTFSVRHALKT